MELLYGLAPLIIGFILLVKGADVFVDGASGLALKLGIPPLIIGLTVVALGTSAPEAAISISSSAQEAEGIAIANVLGSNTMNTLVVLGAVAMIAEIPIRSSTFKVEIPFVLVITLLLLALCASDGVLDRRDALVLLAFLGIYIAYLAFLAHRGNESEEEMSLALVAATGGGEYAGEKTIKRLLLLIALGIFGIALGSNLAVGGATALARVFGVSDRVIALTIVAFGTSLPELAASITAARKGETDIAIGDIVGSSIFNILFVLGVSGTISPLTFAQELVLDGLVALAAAVVLWVACFRTRSLRRGWGAAMLVGYMTYLSYLLVG